jgi:hypothetical protein
LIATNKIDRITLSWTAPSTGHIDVYKLYRKTAADPNFVFLKDVPGGTATVTTDDLAPASAAYNVTYFYQVRSGVISGTSITLSQPSNTVTGIVKHLTVTANASAPYGTIPASFTPTVTGQDVAALNPALVNCTSTIYNASSVGTYTNAINCTGPASVIPVGGTAFIDGIDYVPGTLTITKATATIVVTPYTVTYDGKPHTATVMSITGVNSETGATVGTVDLTHTTNTTAGTHSTDYWSFTGTANYNNIAATTITDTINKANATIVVTPYSVFYDGKSHTATGTATGVGGANLNSLLDLSHTTHTNVGTYTNDYWSFTDPGGNYNNVSNTSITDKIFRHDD